MPGGDDRTLVLVNLIGGNDGLNCIVPHGNSQYYRMRPSLAIASSDVLHINSQVGFNPKMRSMKGLYDKGMVAVVQGVGYPDPNHSHFRSSEIWQTAAPDTYMHTGWLGRYLDSAGLPDKNLFKGVAISQVLPEALVSERIDVPTIANLEQLRSGFRSRSLLAQRFFAGRARPQLTLSIAVSRPGDADRGSRATRF